MNTQQRHESFRRFLMKMNKRAEFTATPKGVVGVARRNFAPIKRSQVNHSHHQVIH